MSQHEPQEPDATRPAPSPHDSDAESPFLAATLESVADAVLVVDAEGRLLQANDAARRLGGPGPAPWRWAIEPTEGWALRQSGGPPLAAAETPLSRALRGEAVDPTELELQAGSAVYCLLAGARPVHDAEGGILGAVGSFRDVTAERHQEAELRATRRQLEQFVENVPAPVAMLDNEMRHLMVSRRFLTDLHLEGQEIIGRNHYDVFPDVPERWRVAHRRALAGEVLRAEEERWERTDGSVVWSRWELRPWRDETGRIGGIMLFIEVITPRKEAEIALRQQQQELRTILDADPALIAYVDADGRLVRVNRAWAEAFGLSEEEEVAGRSVGEVLAGEDLERYLAGNREVIETGQPSRGVIEMARAPDGPRWLETVRVPYRDAAGRIVGIVLISQDISEQRSAEAERARLLAEIDARRRLFESIVDNTPVGIVVLRGPDLICDLANPAFKALAAEPVLLGRPYPEVWPELAIATMPALSSVLRTGESTRTAEVPVQVRRGKDAPVEEVYLTSVMAPIRAPAGPVEAVVVLLIDSTEQVRARRRVAELASLAGRRAVELQAVLDNMTDAVFVVDAAGEVTLANKACLRLFGLADLKDARQAARSPERLKFRHADGTPVISGEQASAKALAGQVVDQETNLLRNPQTQREVLIRSNASAMRDDQGRVVGAVVVSRDVTEMTELDRLKDQFIAVAAHELKTPVAIMKGYSQALLRARPELPAEQGRILMAIDRGANRIDRTVQDLLDISQLQLGRLSLAVEPLDLAELVGTAVGRFSQRSPQSRVRLLRAEPATVRGDRRRLESTVLTLLDNAARYSPGGGEIEVTVEKTEREAIVSVRDHGVGIPRAKQGRVFDLFYRAHTGTPYDYGGMGVGLFIARQVVERLGGRVWFESQEGEGSTFHFGLPLASDEGSGRG